MPLVCFAETMVLYYEMIQMIEMFETTDRFVNQMPHTLYLTLEKLNNWSVHFAAKAEKAVHFLRELFTCVLLVPQSELYQQKQKKNKKATNTTNFFQVNTYKELHAPCWGLR